MARASQVHVVSGDTVAGCLRLALRPRPRGVLVHHDMLSCGPLRPFRSLAAWRRQREAWLRRFDPRPPRFSFAACGRDLYTNAPKLAAATSIILWIGTGLEDQLLLVWLRYVLRLLGVEPSRLRVIQFSREPVRGFEIQSLAMLNPGQLAAHPPPAPLADDALAELDAAWDAITAAVPGPLLGLVSENSTGLPFLRRSLRSLLERFPDLETGLNGWETALLQYTREVGPAAAHIVGHTIAHGTDGPDLVGDGYLFARLRRLGDPRLRQRLVTLHGSGIRLRGTQVSLTDTGRAVLAGRANFVALNGVDDWVGGIHLESASSKVWFRRGGTLVSRRVSG